MRRPLVAICAALLVGALAASTDARTYGTNEEELPPGCDAIVGERSVIVHGGRNYSQEFPGTIFVFDERSWDIPACTRVTVTFVNEDHVRHQFMVHGTHPDGFTLIEADGPGQDSGTFILPAQRETLLVHCGLPQHQQKGMVGQIKVDGGDGDLPGIPGLSGLPEKDRTDYGALTGGSSTGAPDAGKGVPLGAAVPFMALGLAVLALARRRP